MKKYILTVLLSIFALSVFAEGNDDMNKKIWGKGRYIHIGYDWQQTALQDENVEKSSFAFSLTKGTSFLFPKKAVANIVKFGIDVQWFDFGFAKYKKLSVHDENWDSLGTMWDNIDEDEVGGNLDILNSVTNMGRMSMTMGMGIGPIVTVAPFASFNNELSRIKASIYFHYKPTFGVYMLSEDGDISGSYGYCNLYDFGGKITYRFIGIGVEGRWGHGKFSPINLDFTNDDNEEIYGSEINEKLRRNFASTRLYIYFNF